MPLLNPPGILPAPTNREGSVVTVTPQDGRGSRLLAPAPLPPWGQHGLGLGRARAQWSRFCAAGPDTQGCGEGPDLSPSAR